MTKRSLAKSTKQKRRRRAAPRLAAREQTADDEFYEIRDILDEKLVNGRLLYKVDWADNPATGERYDPTWVDLLPHPPQNKPVPCPASLPVLLTRSVFAHLGARRERHGSSYCRLGEREAAAAKRCAQELKFHRPDRQPTGAAPQLEGEAEEGTPGRRGRRVGIEAPEAIRRFRLYVHRQRSAG